VIRLTCPQTLGKGAEGGGRSWALPVLMVDIDILVQRRGGVPTPFVYRRWIEIGQTVQTPTFRQRCLSLGPRGVERVGQHHPVFYAHEPLTDGLAGIGERGNFRRDFHSTKSESPSWCTTAASPQFTEAIPPSGTVPFTDPPGGCHQPEIGIGPDRGPYLVHPILQTGSPASALQTSAGHVKTALQQPLLEVYAAWQA